MEKRIIFATGNEGNPHDFGRSWGTGAFDERSGRFR